MVSAQRQNRRDRQVAQEDPINVTVIEKGQKKVISFKEYKKKYFPKEDETSINEVIE